MKYCLKCGQLLNYKVIEDQNVPYCEACNKLYFPRYNVAVSMIVRYQEDVLLIKQYQKPFPILVAGYVNPLESLEEACRRELKEETNLDAVSIRYLRSSFYEPSDTLMVNFEVIVAHPHFKLNDEVDEAMFYPISKACDVMKPTSLAYQFMAQYVKKRD